MMQHGEAVAEIHAAVGERHGAEGRFVEAHVGLSGEFVARDRQSLHTCIHTIEMTDARRHKRGRAAAAAAGIEADGVVREALPGKNRKVLLEQP